jgi:hypothetical protein
MTDVAQLAQQRVSDQVIINQIRTTGSVYHLSATDIVWLRDNGVSDAVIAEMQATGSRRPGRRVVVGPPPPTVIYEEQPVVVVPRYYGPPRPAPFFGVGLNYTRVR